ncbi:DUF2254 domain-containing protein [Sulfitobacter sp. F26169L]|uniref:DUF2254 domain-containing protein n=1 Tax=Sulfitobacter sp. F26169L TaxID=2996015 RepID=UPI002260A544|nr:DUF2254 domain-containing protein [Sulfitobacter sp. F26169L]MCX7565309.1 DUF2254 domain-containing protein [Sulfitobacter sp. F26169L]
MENINTLFATALRKARRYSRKLWVRVVMMGLLAVVATVLSQLIEVYIPEKLAQSLSGDAADRLLQLIASAMLSVTIFSITVMVSVYQSSSTQWTPRVHRLIMTDKTTQNTLAIFIGAYVYSLLGIILRELGIYVDERAFVLFWMTVLVLVVIVVYLIRWVLHLQGFGQLLDTTRQVEDVTRAQFKDRLARPCLGAHPLTGDVPEGTRTLKAWESGYIQQIYPEALNSIAEKHDVHFYLTQAVGHFAFLDAPLMEVEKMGGELDWDALYKDVQDAVFLADVRNYEQDPRFGLIVMSEIGSKALSPGVNDPGTAIDVITRIGRILSDYKDETKGEPETLLAHLHVPPIDPADLLRDGFGAVSRNGAGTLEVQQRLQQTLAGLMRHPDSGLCRAARDMAREELARALETLSFEPDRKALIASSDPEVRPN